MRASALARRRVGLFCLSTLCCSEVEGLASRVAWYLDYDCSSGEETGTYLLAFGTYNVDFESNTSSLEPFNECYVDIGPTILSGSGVLYTCDVSTGETSFAVYNDEECSDARISVGGIDVCLSQDTDDDDGDVCLEEEACSSTETCTDDEPSTISPNSFNIVAAQYFDDECNNPTGTDSIVSGGDMSAPGFSDEGCFPSESGDLEPAPTYPSMPFLSECLADGSVMIQNFGISDDTCSGPVYFEYHSNFVPNGSTGPDFRPTSVTENSCFQIGDLFYRPIACTLAAVNVESSSTAPPAGTTTPSPTAALDAPGTSEPSPGEPTLTPTESVAATRTPAFTETPVITETPAPTEENLSRDVPDGLGVTPAPVADDATPVAPPSPAPSPMASPSPTLSEAQPLLPETGLTAPPSAGSAETSATGAAARRARGGGGVGSVAAAFFCCLLARVLP